MNDRDAKKLRILKNKISAMGTRRRKADRKTHAEMLLLEKVGPSPKLPEPYTPGQFKTWEKAYRAWEKEDWANRREWREAHEAGVAFAQEEAGLRAELATLTKKLQKADARKKKAALARRAAAMRKGWVTITGAPITEDTNPSAQFFDPAAAGIPKAKRARRPKKPRSSSTLHPAPKAPKARPAPSSPPKERQVRPPRPPRKPRTIAKAPRKRGRYAEALRLNLRTGEPERDTDIRPRKHRGAQVNDPLPLPLSPDVRVVDQDECHECGEHYKRWTNSGCSTDTIQPTGPYRSRGTLLWALRVCKMGEWYARHRSCVEFAHDPDAAAARLPPPMVWSLIHGDGEIPDGIRLNRKQRAFVDGYQAAVEAVAPSLTWDEFGDEEEIPF